MLMFKKTESVKILISQNILETKWYRDIYYGIPMRVSYPRVSVFKSVSFLVPLGSK